MGDNGNGDAWRNQLFPKGPGPSGAPRRTDNWVLRAAARNLWPISAERKAKTVQAVERILDEAEETGAHGTFYRFTELLTKFDQSNIGHAKLALDIERLAIERDVMESTEGHVEQTAEADAADYLDELTAIDDADEDTPS